jgi:tRNA pseudouridine13 synthase
VRLKSEPEDFQVEEIPAYEPCGDGSHTFLFVEKRLRNSDEVARALARAAGVAPRDVGYAGRKDRVAVTRQWFSVPDLDPERALAIELEGVRVLRAERHRNKLRTGHLRGNRFAIRAREVGAADIARAQDRALELAQRGMPNRFGDQRFGRDGDNAERARAILVPDETARAPRVRDRRELRFLISALQSAVFNAVLAERADGFDRLELGDVAVVHASGGLFCVEDLAREQARADAFEISATGPIFGSRSVDPTGAPQEREREVMRRFGLDGPLRVPRGIELRGTRRPLRVRPVDLALTRDSESDLWLRFELPPGSYATVLLEELFGEVLGGEASDASRAALSSTPLSDSP